MSLQADKPYEVGENDDITADSQILLKYIYLIIADMQLPR